MILLVVCNDLDSLYLIYFVSYLPAHALLQSTRAIEVCLVAISYIRRFDLADKKESQGVQLRDEDVP